MLKLIDASTILHNIQRVLFSLQPPGTISCFFLCVSYNFLSIVYAGFQLHLLSFPFFLLCFHVLSLPSDPMAITAAIISCQPLYFSVADFLIHGINFMMIHPLHLPFLYSSRRSLGRCHLRQACIFA